MGPERRTWVFFATFALFLSDFAFSEDDLNEEELAYVAKDDIEDFQRRLEIFGKEYGRKWMVMPDGDDVSHLAILKALEGGKDEFTGEVKISDDEIPDVVILRSYSKKFPEGQAMQPGDVNTLLFDSAKPTKMICHGWMASGNSSVVHNIRDAYLENQDVNVIGIDWSALSKDFFYPNAVMATPKVGKYLASVIDSLVEERGAKYNDFHIVGHSLGAHISGFAGMNTKQKIGRITGLDPALPGFQYLATDSGRLDPSDANFVDVIHTCAGILGMSKRAGHVDFFPNGGTPFQPGCGFPGLPTRIQACSHGRSHQLFAESIRHSEFKAIGCKDWDHFKSHSCKKVFTLMGEYVSSKVRGPFYLKTQEASPFALGLNGTVY